MTAPEQETPEIPEETCDVEYKQMSDGVTFTTEKDGSVIKLNLVIGEEASGDLVLDLSKVINEASGITYLPGVKQKFEVTIQNNSGHTFGYKDNSFVLSTLPTVLNSAAWEMGSCLYWVLMGSISLFTTPGP